MFAELKDKELHIYGEVADFNAIARSIHKGRHGASASFPLSNEGSSFTALITKCSGQLGTIQAEGQEVHINYSEAVKNRLYAYFSMPSGTQPGSLFLVRASQQDSPSILSNSSLDLALHVIAGAA